LIGPPPLGSAALGQLAEVEYHEELIQLFLSNGRETKRLCV
jgi:hypothetical protein